MSRAATKTDTSYFEEKVKLRIDGLPHKVPVKVLDLFSGNGKLWTEIQKRSGREILVLRIDREKGKRGAYLIGDNLKFDLNCDKFDVIDVDAYGVPFNQLEKIFSKSSAPKTIFITSNQSLFGALPNKMLNGLGYTDAMIKKIPTLFYRDGQKKFLEYLGNRGISLVKMYSTPNGRKNYLSIRID